jgi:hypothetical protein
MSGVLRSHNIDLASPTLRACKTEREVGRAEWATRTFSSLENHSLLLLRARIERANTQGV